MKSDPHILGQIHVKVRLGQMHDLTCMESGVRQSVGSREMILTVLSARPTARNLQWTTDRDWVKSQVQGVTSGHRPGFG